MIDQQDLLDRCLSLRQNLCLERDRCERLLEEAPMSWTVKDIHEYRELRDEADYAISQLDRGLAKLQGVTGNPPEKKRSRAWTLIVFAALVLLLVLAVS